jgi:CRP-like cAMP-binding protein
MEECQSGNQSLLSRKLEQFVPLSLDDRNAIEQIIRHKVIQVPAQTDLICEGDEPTHVRLILDGWACRYKMLDDGRRQIMAIFLPGDMCDFNVFILRKMDHSIMALTPVRLAAIYPDALETLTGAHPRILKGLWWETLVNASIQREWTVNLGQRSALERIAHLFCEIFLRLQAVGMIRENRCNMPITQIELADAMGLTAVHVSRTLKTMRAEGLVKLNGRELLIPDFGALQSIGLFNPNYLHFERPLHNDSGLERSVTFTPTGGRLA